jgi:hypothetical protein
MGLYRGLDTDEGWIQRRFAKLERDIVEGAAARRLVVATEFAQASQTVTFTSGFADYLSTNITVPEGYNVAIVQMFASAGTTFSGTGAGNVGIQAVAGSIGGPAISQGKTGGGPSSVNAGLAAKVPVSFGTPLVVRVGAYANGDPRVAGSDNVHLSATAIFVRE